MGWENNQYQHRFCSNNAAVIEKAGYWRIAKLIATQFGISDKTDQIEIEIRNNKKL